MNTLILDCSAGMSVYLLVDEKVFSHIDNNQKKHTDELLVTVDKLFESANIKVSMLDNVCVCIGPGSFTGIRVAVSIAKGLVIGTGAKIYTCSNFDIYQNKNSDNEIYILEGFSSYVYTRVISNGMYIDKCENIDDVIENLKLINKDYKIYVQTEKLQNLLKNNEISSNIAQNNTILCFKNIISTGKDTILNQISPIYLRASQAEIEREKRLNKNENK